MDRRTLLAGLAGSAALASTPVHAAPGTRAIRAEGTQGGRYAAALDALADYAAREMAFWGLPGLTLSIVDADGFAAVMTFGKADVDRGVAVTPDHLFQIGSISKSFAAATLLTFVDEGKLDLDAPLARYLTDLALPPEPITTRQVLTHSAGLPGNAPLFPQVPGGRLWCGFRPGADFSYSNTGYEIMGLLIQQLGGMPWPEVIRRRTIAPLGMRATRPAIVDRDRARYATGYAPLVATRPFLPGDALAPGPWTDVDVASGSIASTPDDMAHYLRFLIGAARGEGAGILSPRSARLFTTPLVDASEFGPGARYGLGLATVQVGGTPCLHHTGGMLTFVSSLHVDGAAGVGCFASVNADLDGSYRPRRITAYAVELLRAARAGTAAPAAPDLAAPTRVEDGAALAGRYVAPDGAAFELLARGSDLRLRANGAQGRVASAGESLATDHPRFRDWALHPERQGTRVTGLWWAGTLWGRDAALAQPAVPDRLRALTGWYESSDRWVGGVVIRAHGERLATDSVYQTIWDSSTTLTERDGYWTTEAANSVERLRFEAPVAGQPSILNVSGAILTRRALA